MTSSGLGQAVWARRPTKTYLSPYLAAGDTFGRTGPCQAARCRARLDIGVWGDSLRF